MCRPKFESNTSRLQLYNFTATIICSVIGFTGFPAQNRMFCRMYSHEQKQLKLGLHEQKPTYLIYSDYSKPLYFARDISLQVGNLGESAMHELNSVRD